MFREKIRGAMNELGVGVKVLAQKTGINQNSISSFLSGSRSISNSNLETIMRELDLTLLPKSNFVYEKSVENTPQSEIGNGK